MISENSILRKIPINLDPKQALFLDGFRQSAEFATIANSRLIETLTEIIDQRGANSDPTGSLITKAMLDAWSLVDSIDRFRGLWQLFPGPDENWKNQEGYTNATNRLREIRNVSDHLAQRVDYVLAHSGSASGTLSWFTTICNSPFEGYACTIIPGLFSEHRKQIVGPEGIDKSVRTCKIELSLGEHTASLSECVAVTRKCVNRLEEGYARYLSDDSTSKETMAIDSSILARYIDPSLKS